MSDPRQPMPQPPEEPGATDLPEATAGEDAAAEASLRANPRRRPPDPAGTRPEWDPRTLLPRSRPSRAPGALWSTERADEHDDAGEGAGEREGATAAMAAVGAPAGAAAGAGGTAASQAAPPAATAPAGGDGAGADARRTPFNPHFQFALGALMAIAAAAVVLFVAVLAGGGDRGSTVARLGPTWSAWQPDGSGDGATQIAQHVGRQYRLPDGKQLVAVTGGPLQIAGLPVTIAIRRTPAQGGDIDLIDGSGVLYRMCGLETNCKLAGKPSVKRGMLLRREALELALYSFRYLGVDDATVFLPPNKDEKTPSHALFFRRGDADLQGPVSQPLDATLTPHTPSVASINRSPDVQLVDSITSSKVFQVSFTQANQDARAFMVLDPVR